MNPKVITDNLKNDFFSQRKKQKDKFHFWITSTYVTMLTLFSMLLIYYVWILNANATKWDMIRQLENTKSELLMEKQRLDVRIAELESLDGLLNSDDIENMEDIKDPDYLVIKENVQYVYNNN